MDIMIWKRELGYKHANVSSVMICDDGYKNMKSNMHATLADNIYE
jgi:hypothetical protein